MTFLRWGGLSSLGVGVLVLACGGGGDGGGMGPCVPGAATQLVKTGGDAQSWYFNNPLPASLGFTATGSAPPTTAAVTVVNNAFNPDNVTIQVGGTVTWTWNSGGVEHNVTYNSPDVAAGRTNSATQGLGNHVNTITTVGRFGYSC